MTVPGSLPAHLEPSQLGTKEYWDALYTNEISNHAANPSDTGTVWFDDSDAEAKLVAFLSSRAASSHPHPLPRDTTTFLDLGCGNGSLLGALRAARWRGPMLGVDYSAQSVALAQRIAAAPPERSDDESDDDDGSGAEPGSRAEEAAGGDVAAPPVFAEWDIINGAFAPVLEEAGQPRGWDVVLDKGTFDAVSLSDERGPDGRRINEKYRERVLRLVKPGGLFLITSCNWTEAELETWFVGEDKGDGDGDDAGGGRFAVDGKVVYKSFSFGGVKGQTINSVCFKKIL